MSATIHLTTKEDRRTWQALTRCAPTVDDDPELAFVCLDGRRAYATDTYLVGCLEGVGVDLPVRKSVDEETGSTLARPDRVLLPAVLLRDAIGLAKGKTHARIRLEADAALVILGEDPLPGLGDPPTVRIPYADNERFPSVAKLAAHLDGASEDLEVDGAGIKAAGELATRIGIDADRLSLLAALEYRLADQVHGYVTIRPRPATTILEIRSVATGTKLGVIAQVRIHDEVRAGSVASHGGRDITITSNTAGILAEHFDGDEPEALDDALD